ncbi:MAG: ATP-dependent DNA helicase UvrD2 [Acidimicrobiales bacterium]|nr:ATP-dependent DNA helicase UvrD2 [Acidimicrobiales bacterium]
MGEPGIDDLLARLDESQRIAVDQPATTLRILAGPGSGKTRVLTARIARRAADEIDPRRAMTLTFTRRAANELRQRLAAAGVRDLGPVGTFHAVALQQVRQRRLDRGKAVPRIIGSRVALLRSLADNPTQARAAVAVEATISAGTEPRNRVEADLARRYNEHKRRQNLLDFDDILAECTHMLTTDQAFADAQRWRFRHFFVDEFQDVNHTQFELLRAWLGDRDDLCVVGDPDQAIYEWNGADAAYLTDFERWFPNATTVALSTNHRSAAPIIAAAHAVLGERDVVVRRQAGASPTTSDHSDPEAEARSTVERIRWAHSTVGRWSDHAVLARTNAQLDLVASAFSAAGIPHRIRGRGGLSQDPAATAIVDELKSSGPSFAVRLIDLETEHIGSDDADVVSPVLELAREYVSGTDQPHGSGFAAWLTTLRAGDVGVDHDVVDLVTFHAAKGLEWPHVTIVGTEEGLVPMNDSAEERRLAYVAVTRAERSLHLSWCRSRTVQGVAHERYPSRWLGSISTQAPPPVPPTEDQRRSFLASARAATMASTDGATRRRLERLQTWRDTTARARRIDPEALLRDEAMVQIARRAPADLDELCEASGLSPIRLRRDHVAILAAIHRS